MNGTCGQKMAMATVLIFKEEKINSGNVKWMSWYH
jgi:hypothetical protein